MSKVLNTAAALAVLFAAPIQAATIAIDMSGFLVEPSATGTSQSTLFDAPGAGDLAAGDAFEAHLEIDTDAPNSTLSSTGDTRYRELSGFVTIDGTTVPVASASTTYIDIGNDTSNGQDRLSYFMTFSGASLNDDLTMHSFSITFIDSTQTVLNDQELTVENLNAFDEPIGAAITIRNPTFGVPGGYEETEFLLRAFVEIDSYSATLLDDGTSGGSIDPAPIPLPAGAPLLVAGLGALWAVRRNKRAA